MAGNLVIVESPAKAKTIQKFLGGDFVVKSSFGHIRDLHEKNLSIDVKNGFKPEYEIPAGKKKIVSDLKDAASKADMVWLASDEDREGEAISWHLSETLKLDPAKTRRIAFHEITKSAIETAIKNPRSIDLNLVNAQQARRVLDRLVGFELSPVLWRKVKRGLSAGRVQSVTLRLVVDREREIAAFSPEAYYKVDAQFLVGNSSCNATLDRHFATLEEARGFLRDSIGARFTAAAVDKKEGKRFPAPPFTTSTLQQEAARKLHLSVSTTMRLAQGLYERGLITYMRTDSTNLSSLAINTARDFINDNFGAGYSHSRQYKTKSKGAQEAHEAIRPTFIGNTSIEGTPQEQKLYNLIWKRTVASQMTEASLMNTSISIDSDRREEKFIMKSTEILFDGFLKLYIEGVDDSDAEGDENIAITPSVKEGDILDVVCINADCKYTQAPFRYSEQTLVKKMEELGIGRPSTYASTVSTLTSGRGYLVKGDKEGRKVEVDQLVLRDGVISSGKKTISIGEEKGKLLPQDIGLMVNDYLVEYFPDIMDYDFTANVEKDFDEIAEGKAVWNKTIEDFYTAFHDTVEKVIARGEFSHLARELGVDPSDGKKIVAKFGQYGPYVQKGDASEKIFASLGKGQLIESLTLEEAIKLFSLPRNVGKYEGVDVVALKGRFGPYLKYGERNLSLPKGCDPVKVSLEECIALIVAEASKTPSNTVIAEFKDEDISIISGRYGPYIKHSSGNFKIPSGKDAQKLTLEDCKAIIADTEPSKRRFSRFTKKK